MLNRAELITQEEMAVDELIDVVGRDTIVAVMTLSSPEAYGPKHPGKKNGDSTWYGRQRTTIKPADRKLRVDKTRIRYKGKGSGKELEIPANQAMLMNRRLGTRMLDTRMRGFTTRHSKKIVPEITDTVGVSKSAVSREFIEQREQTLKELCESRFEDVDILVVYIDGLRFGQDHVIAALGVDSGGYKHVLGLREGSSENAVVAKDLLTDIVSRGLNPQRRRLFVIDGSKALRGAIDEVFGSDNPVQRCRNHKVRNVLGYLPYERKADVQVVMKAAFALDADKGIGKLKKLAEWLSREHPSAASSLLEGLDEMFTINRLGLPKQLCRCLGSTNVIESPYSGVRQKTGRVTRWRDGQMVLRWTASALLSIEKRMRRIMGYEQLWVLEAKLTDADGEQNLAEKGKVA